MASTKIEFDLAVEFVDAGEYQVLMDGQVVKVSITYIDNKTISRMHMIESEPMGKKGHIFALNVKVVIEFSYLPSSFGSHPNELANIFVMASKEDFNRAQDQAMKVKSMCIECLNKIVAVTRWKTRVTWIPLISEGDIFEWKISIRYDQGTSASVGYADHGSHLWLPHSQFPQKKVNSEILPALSKGEEVPFYDQVYLDAHSYYERARYNEAVILANVALEQLARTHLFDKLEKEHDQEKAKKIKKQIESTKHFTSIMSTWFKCVADRSLEDNSDLWKKLVYVRDKRRIAVHPHAKRLNEEEDRMSITYIHEICSWIDPDGII